MRIDLKLHDDAWIDVLDYVPWSVTKHLIYMRTKMDLENDINNTTEEDHDRFNEAVMKGMVTQWHIKRPGTEVFYDRAPKSLTPEDFEQIDGRIVTVVIAYTNMLFSKQAEEAKNQATSDPN